MNRFIILGFDYRETIHYCLIRCKSSTTSIEYAITIMNGELESALFGQHILLEENGCLLLTPTGNAMLDCLKESIACALSELLNLPLSRVTAVD